MRNTEDFVPTMDNTQIVSKPVTSLENSLQVIFGHNPLVCEHEELKKNGTYDEYCG